MINLSRTGKKETFLRNIGKINDLNAEYAKLIARFRVEAGVGEQG